MSKEKLTAEWLFSHFELVPRTQSHWRNGSLFFQPEFKDRLGEPKWWYVTPHGKHVNIPYGKGGIAPQTVGDVEYLLERIGRNS